MNFLADENIDGQIVYSLRKHGIIVEYVAEFDPGIDDNEVLELSFSKKLILITSDKDFGELIFRKKLTHCGILLLRLSGLRPDEKAIIVSKAVIELKDKLLNSFTVITPKSIRIRSIPKIH